jgi:hypothetical protein
MGSANLAQAIDLLDPLFWDKIIFSADFIMQTGHCRAVEFDNPAAMLTNQVPVFVGKGKEFIVCLDLLMQLFRHRFYDFRFFKHDQSAIDGGPGNALGATGQLINHLVGSEMLPLVIKDGV